MVPQVWLNPCMRTSASEILDLSVGILGSSSSSLLPESVTKESLQHARVLQQVDTKFIAVVAQNILLLVDQVSTYSTSIYIVALSMIVLERFETSIILQTVGYNS